MPPIPPTLPSHNHQRSPLPPPVAHPHTIPLSLPIILSSYPSERSWGKVPPEDPQLRLPQRTGMCVRIILTYRDCGLGGNPP